MVPSIRRALTCNHLLEALPSRDRQRVLDGCESVRLGFGDVVYEPGHPIEHVHFPTTSFISLFTRAEDGGLAQ